MTDTHAHPAPHAVSHGDAHGHAAPKHPYHLVDPSPWPLVGAIAAGALPAARSSTCTATAPC